MINGCKITIILLLTLFILACSEHKYEQPSCRVNANVASAHQGAGACIITMNKNLMVIQLSSGLYDLPIARSISLSSEQNTASRRTSAQCLAHQAMWQQTGLNVEVQGLVGAQSDGTWLFGCEVNAGFDGTEAPFNTPSWSDRNVVKVAFINPFEIERQNWARSSHFDVMRNAYILQETSQKPQ